MPIGGMEEFSNLDVEKYIIQKNQELLEWINQQIDNKYVNFINISQLQKLMDKLVWWFEFKYPERKFEDDDSLEFKDMINISKYMNFQQLLFRLTEKELNFIKCPYLCSGGWASPIYDKHGHVLYYEPQISMIIRVKNQKNDDNNFVSTLNCYDFLLSANANTGHVLIDHNIENMIPYINNIVTLEDMLKIFEETKKQELDYSELEKCIYNHKIDLELRKKVLQLVALKLIYSKNTILDYGYERARRFISEFNKHIPDLNLSIKEIEQITKNDYNEMNKKTLEETNITLGQKIKRKLLKK